MNSWIDGPKYDAWKTTPPEPPASDFFCDRCNGEFQSGDQYYELDGEKLCRDCALDWLDEHSCEATPEECYGEE